MVEKSYVRAINFCTLVQIWGTTLIIPFYTSFHYISETNVALYYDRFSYFADLDYQNKIYEQIIKKEKSD